MTTDYSMNMYMYRQAYTSVARLLRETDSEKIWGLQRTKSRLTKCNLKVTN